MRPFSNLFVPATYSKQHLIVGKNHKNLHVVNNS